MDIEGYWRATIHQDAEAMRKYFMPAATIRWHNTNEQFTVEEFIEVNCDYPGDFDGQIERIERIDNLIVTVVHIFSKDGLQSVHATSFIRTQNHQIIELDEYWGDDGLPPSWRLDKKIGKKIMDDKGW